ncbi:hypothetical protein [Flaviflexus huanghaiensis]|uniref:hypothetical protein n=1 Tax=Flaviflexus huanghaiensis TaxID=1111473 RepID=UPI0015F9D0DD|nr:hypothetical protein [Flaviflexus huanghaiensis]
MSTPELEKYRLPEARPFDNHGRTVAGWTWAIGVCIAALVIGFGLVFSTILIWIGVALIAVITAVSLALRAAGKGQPNRLTHTAKRGAWYNE